MPLLQESIQESTKEAHKIQPGLLASYRKAQERGLKLNMARGKPSPEQLDLSSGMLNALGPDELVGACHAGQADDRRNYGDLLGIPEARALMAAIMEVPPDSVIVANNSSLSIMYDLVSRAMTHGLAGEAPWARLPEGERPVFVCPAPGYDRHFAATAHFGIEMITVAMRDDGPDMDHVESLVESKEHGRRVKGIWCVPKYSNPTGVTYSEEVVRRLAALKSPARDFRIYWDNAYAVHDLGEQGDTLFSIKQACDEAGNPDRWYQLASTSKITFAGAGIAAVASSPANIDEIARQLAMRTIGPDKLNQLRHVMFLRDLKGVRAHMRRHAELLRPKFETVLRVLAEELGGQGLGEWTRPNGGYFISFDGPVGTARRVVELCADAGVVLTAAGATYPGGVDPHDKNIRIAPTYPSVEELEQASCLFALCVKIAAAEKAARL
ncbi:MAG: aminotransferase class I/II-fold pyridoxal phosphate-dependent enzyme [Coriobacteriales bacterium]|jgi:aspartate/methionine/tyrosine aminotransferase|nr:aminotransferase class I/II-fold pyridoxal phosphate-dependent enzyme [Coriobacteriales bacterium]